MGSYRAGAVALLLWASAALGQTLQAPAYAFSGSAPTGACTGYRVWISTSTGAKFCCTGTTWATCDPAGGANTQVQFNDGGAFGGDAGLTYDKATDVLTATGGFVGPSLSAASGGITLLGAQPNAGTNQVVRIGNAPALGGSTELISFYSDNFTTKRSHVGSDGFLYFDIWGAGNSIILAQSAFNSACMTLGSSVLCGLASGAGDVGYTAKSLRLSSTAGNDALWLTGGGRLRFDNGAGNAYFYNSAVNTILTPGTLQAASFVGPLTGNASTATALSTAGSSNQYWGNGNVWRQPSFSELSGTATAAQIPAATNAARGGVLVPAADCNTAATSKVLYTSSTNTFSCGTDQTGAGGSMPKVVTTNVTNSTTTPANITGLSWSVSASTEYGFACTIIHQGTATGGPRFNLNGPASPTNVTIRWQRATSATADTSSTDTAFSAAAQTAAITSGGTTTVLVSKVNGHIINGANAGTAQFMLTSSTSGQTVTVYRGSFCVVY